MTNCRLLPDPVESRGDALVVHVDPAAVAAGAWIQVDEGLLTEAER